MLDGTKLLEDLRRQEQFLRGVDWDLVKKYSPPPSKIYDYDSPEWEPSDVSMPYESRGKS